MKAQLTANVDHYPGHPVRVVVEFTLPYDTPIVRAKDFGDVIKQAVAEGVFVAGSVNHHHPVTWQKQVGPYA